MRRIDAYRIKRGDNLGDAEFWNTILEDLDIRIGLNEDKLKNLDAVANRMESLALERINNSITPLVIQTQDRIASIPNLFSATSVTSVEIGAGTKTFFVEASARNTFAVGGYVLARRIADGSAWMTGALVSYSQTTGALVIDVDNSAGEGTFTDWRFYTAGRKGQKGDKGDRGATYRPGGYNAATAYAKDDMVTDQGCLWINIAADGSTNIAPPTLPATSNATWEVAALRPANVATDIAYDTGSGTISVAEALGALGSGVEAKAPNDANYLVKTASDGLSAGRVVTDDEIEWDWSTPGQVLAKIASSMYASAANICAGVAKIIRADALWDAAAPYRIDNVSGTINLDFSQHLNYVLALNGNTTLGAPTGLKPGQSFGIWFVQDEAGGKTMSFSSGWIPIGGTTPTFNTGSYQANYISGQLAYDDGTNWSICYSGGKAAYAAK